MTAAPSGRLGGREGRHGRGKFIEESHQARMILAPRAVEAKILAGERTGNRDLADIRWRIATGWRGFERGERARHLAGLMVDPFRLMLGRIAPARLVDPQERALPADVGAG